VRVKPAPPLRHHSGLRVDRLDARSGHRTDGCRWNSRIHLHRDVRHRGEGTPAPFDTPRKFVATGPYQFVRNPMYEEVLTVLFGFGLYEQSRHSAFHSAVLLLVHLFVILYEEPHLRATFSTTYELIAVRCAAGCPAAGPRVTHGLQLRTLLVGKCLSDFLCVIYSLYVMRWGSDFSGDSIL